MGHFAVTVPDPVAAFARDLKSPAAGLSGFMSGGCEPRKPVVRKGVKQNFPGRSGVVALGISHRAPCGNLFTWHLAIRAEPGGIQLFVA
jgi:hypothetical protein